MEKRISRIDLADCKNVDQLVAQILKLIPDLKPPIPVEELARDLDITGIQELKADGFVGALITDSDKSSGTILVKNDLGDHRRRFTVGHELGHFLCPTHVPVKDHSFYCSARDMAMSAAPKSNLMGMMEVQANRFSATLLMPEKLFRARIPARKDPDLKHAQELSGAFQTSMEATVRRYVDLQDKPCAVIMSKDGKVRYPYRHEDFPYLPASKDDPLPRGTISAKADIPADHLSEVVDVDAETWLDAHGARRVEYLTEQVLVQQSGYRITLLSAELTNED
jgi:Zn-dependent peptidase ImmA (M78 family)